jgi:hypothetical protein
LASLVEAFIVVLEHQTINDHPLTVRRTYVHVAGATIASGGQTRN